MVAKIAVALELVVGRARNAQIIEFGTATYDVILVSRPVPLELRKVVGKAELTFSGILQ